MPQIGDFIRGEAGFAGRIRTLLLDIEVSILPAEPSDAGNAPDYRLYHGDGDAAREIGAAWTHTGEKAGDYLSVLIDDPMFAHPVRANLFRNCVEAGSWSLHWNRPPKRDGKE